MFMMINLIIFDIFLLKNSLSNYITIFSLFNNFETYNYEKWKTNAIELLFIILVMIIILSIFEMKEYLKKKICCCKTGGAKDLKKVLINLKNEVLKINI